MQCFISSSWQKQSTLSFKTQQHKWQKHNISSTSLWIKHDNTNDKNNQHNLSTVLSLSLQFNPFNNVVLVLSLKLQFFINEGIEIEFAKLIYSEWVKNMKGICFKKMGCFNFIFFKSEMNWDMGCFSLGFIIIVTLLVWIWDVIWKWWRSYVGGGGNKKSAGDDNDGGSNVTGGGVLRFGELYVFRLGRKRRKKT